MHKDKLRVSYSSSKVSKERWEEIFGKPEDGPEFKKAKPEFEGDFTNGGLMGRNRKEY